MCFDRVQRAVPGLRGEPSFSGPLATNRWGISRPRGRSKKSTGCPLHYLVGGFHFSVQAYLGMVSNWNKQIYRMSSDHQTMIDLLVIEQHTIYATWFQLHPWHAPLKQYNHLVLLTHQIGPLLSNTPNQKQHLLINWGAQQHATTKLSVFEGTHTHQQYLYIYIHIFLILIFN